MSSRALHSRASASSSEFSGDSHPSTSHTMTVSSHTSDKRQKRQKSSTSQLSGHSSDHSTASDSSLSPTSSSTPGHSSQDHSIHGNHHQAPQSKSNGSSKKRAHRAPQEPHFFPNSTTSSGFSSAMSDTSAHSTSGTSSPYASGVGSVFSTHRLSPSDIKYRDERPKVLRTFIIGKLIGEGTCKEGNGQRKVERRNEEMEKYMCWFLRISAFRFILYVELIVFVTLPLLFVYFDSLFSYIFTFLHYI